MDYYQALSRYCSYQERCLQEIEEKLTSLQAPEEDWSQLIERLQTDEFWNEERFARSFARGKFRIKGWGRVRIRQELIARGISADLIQKAFSEIEEPEYYQTVLKLARKKMTELRKETELMARQKLYRYLIQKGFESGLVYEIINQNLSDTE